MTSGRAVACAMFGLPKYCLLYTSDAADDLTRVDLGGRRLIKKKKLWQMCTIQVDFQTPDRFDLSYVSDNGARVRPVMIHRALFGAIERFVGVLVEHFAGAFPTWLAPVQAVLI